MKKLKLRVSRIALACSFSMVTAWAQPALAQYVVDGGLESQAQIQAQIPLNDANCPFHGYTWTIEEPDCTVNGTRSVELQSILSRSPIEFNGSTVNSMFDGVTA